MGWSRMEIGTTLVSSNPSRTKKLQYDQKIGVLFIPKVAKKNSHPLYNSIVTRTRVHKLATSILANQS